ncbi:MAG: hypothetical protein K0S08_83 [Gammaproteobacteria bacterium]|jgi:hypothetical protein|nr:hypothetical protein [Gammaproteobacteria bacterium]
MKSKKTNSTNPSKTKHWSKTVTEHSHALQLEKNVFTWNSPEKIAHSLWSSALQSTQRKGTPLQSAMSMLNFYINRAGKNLNPSQKNTLLQTKIVLRKIANSHKTNKERSEKNIPNKNKRN